MAAIDWLSSCGPQANVQPPPPIAQAPKPIRAISRSEFPSFLLSMFESDRDHDLSNMRTGLHVRYSLARLLKRKHFADYRPQFYFIDCTVHIFEHRPRTGEDTVQPNLFHENWHIAEFPVYFQRANESDMASHPY